MLWNKMFFDGKKEKKVIKNTRKHIKLLCAACNTFKLALETHDKKLMRNIINIESEGDSIRREIISNIYEGAFLPYIRPDLCRFVENVDQVFDLIEDAAFNYIQFEIPDEIHKECERAAFFNIKICEMLLISFETVLKGDDLREKVLGIRIYEKKIDDIKFVLLRDIQKIPVKTFWEGKNLSDFISNLTNISDVIEDAGDHLQIINLIMK